MDPITKTKPQPLPMPPADTKPEGSKTEARAAGKGGATGNPLMDAVVPGVASNSVVEFFKLALNPMPGQSSGAVTPTLKEKLKDPTVQAEMCKTAVPFVAEKAGGFVGGQVGGAVGAEAATITSGPEAAVVGAFVGKKAGELAGKKAGKAVGEKVAEAYCPKPPATPTPPKPAWTTPQIAKPSGANACPVPTATPLMTPMNATTTNADGTVS